MVGTMRVGLACLLLLSLTNCTPGLYKRDVTALILGPSRVAVGQNVLLLVRLDYSDGTSLPAEPSIIDGRTVSAEGHAEWASSDPARASVGRNTGLVTGISPGEVVITATPSVMTTGTGRRTAGIIRMTVTE